MLIHVMVKREDGEYVAHALEFDLMSAGDTPEDAIRAIKDSIATYFEACRSMGLDPRDCGRPAPQEFYDEYKQIFKKPNSVFWIGTLDAEDLTNHEREEAAVG